MMTSPIIAIPAWNSGARETVRLTARGRALRAAVLVLVLAATLAAVLAVTAAWPAQPVVGDAGRMFPEVGVTAAGVDAAVVQHTVVSGDTLWDLASAIDPGGDPRPIVDRIQQLNGLSGSELTVGMRLRLPVQTPAQSAAG
jgi:LysM domain